MRTEFIIPENLCIEDLQSVLEKKARLHGEPAQTIYRTYYDSFDWRLYQDGSLLEDTRINKEHTLVWQGLKGKYRCPRLRLRAAPRFVWDLPQGPFRGLMEPVLEMRELVPKVKIRSRVTSLRILNKDKKTVAWLALEENTLMRQKGRRSRPLDNRAVVIQVRASAPPGKAW